LAKQGQEYSEEDFKELESLVYDKFTIKLTDTKVLIAESVEKSRKEIQYPSGGDMHLIEKIDMDFLCETCIVPRSTQLTKIKLSGHLPLISINFSDQKYKTLMNVIDIIVPSIDDDNMETPTIEETQDGSTQANIPKRAMSTNTYDGQKGGVSSSFGMPVWVGTADEPLYISDSEDSGSESSDETLDSRSQHLISQSSSDLTFSKHKDDTQVSNEYKQTNFSLSFKIDRVKASLKEARPDEANQEILLCDLVLEQFLLVFTQRKFDMTVDVSLKTLSVIDQMEHGREFTYLITSDEITSDSSASIQDKKLVTVKYRKINSSSPEYCDVDQSVDVELSALNIVVTRSSILTLYNFILSTFTTPTKEPKTGASTSSGKHSRRESANSTQANIKSKRQDQQKESSENGGGVIKVQVCLESLDLILNDDGVRLATGCLSHGDVTVVVKPTTLSVDVKIGNFELKDDLTSPDVDPSNLQTDHSKIQLLSLEGQELATFRYATYDKESQRYPGYDQLIFLRMGSLRLNFLEHTIHQLVDYGARFAEMKVVYDSAREAAVSSAQQIQQTESFLHFDVKVRSPTLIFPSTDPRRPKDQLIAHLGEVSVENTFSDKNLATAQLQRLETSVLENSIRARVNSVHLKSEFMLKDPDTKEEQMQSLSILDELHMDFTINIVPHTAGTLRPDTQITGHVSNISMNLTESQFKFLMTTSNSVTAAFTASGENTDEVEDVNEDPLAMEAIRSVGITEENNGSTSAALKDAVQAEIHGKRQSSRDENEDIWTTLDMSVDFQGIKLEIFRSEGSLRQEDLQEWSLARFSLEDSGFKLCTKSDLSMFLELQVESLVLNDTRLGIHSEFREIMKRTRKDGPQLQLRYETTPHQDTSDQYLLLALDTPCIILSLDHVFELQKYFIAPFTVEEATEAQMFAESQKHREANGSADLVSGQQSVSRMKQTKQTQNDKQATSTQGVLSYKINIVDPEIILLANPAVEDSEAIVLSAEQVLISQKSLLTVNVSKIGMFLCAMNSKEEVKVRFVDEFEISVSMESHTSANHNITSIVIDLQALVLRVSYLDISIITNVVNHAIELMGSSEPPASPTDENPQREETEDIGDIPDALAPPAESRSMNTSGLKKRTSIEPYIVMSRETVKQTYPPLCSHIVILIYVLCHNS
jgi:vacuolar protein sorting-associated protein 13A/C